MSVTDKLDVTGTKPVEGGYLAVRANVARAGVYQYTRREIGMADGNPNELVGVYRSPEFTFDEKSLASIAHRPVTINHPPAGVSAKTWKKDAVGHIGSAVWEADDRKHVVVDMLLMDAAGVTAAQTTHKQISLGYTADILPEIGTSPEGEPYVAVMSGVYSCNHAALVPQGRAGFSCRVGDAAWPTDVQDTTPPKKETKLPHILYDGLKFDLADAEATQALVTKLVDAEVKANGRADKAVTDLADAQTVAATAATLAATALADEQAKVATLEAEKATLAAELTDARDPAKLRDAAAAYGATVAKAKALGIDVADNASEADVKSAAVKHKLGDVGASWTPAQIDVSFATLTASVTDTAAPDAFRDAMSNRNVADFSDAAAKAKTAREKMIAGFNAPRELVK